MKATLFCQLTLAALVAVISFNPAPGTAQPMTVGDCNDSTSCTQRPGPFCDDNVAVGYLEDGLCSDHDGDDTNSDRCVYEATRMDCGDDAVCHAGTCLSVSRPGNLLGSDEECDIETLAVSAGCSGTELEVTYWESITGGCDRKTVMLDCDDTGERCVKFDESSAGCVASAPFAIEDLRPDTVGTEDGMSWSDWSDAADHLVRDIDEATSDDPCMELAGNESRLRDCQHTYNFVTETDDAVREQHARDLLDRH